MQFLPLVILCSLFYLTDTCQVIIPIRVVALWYVLNCLTQNNNQKVKDSLCVVLSKIVSNSKANLRCHATNEWLLQSSSKYIEATVLRLSCNQADKYKIKCQHFIVQHFISTLTWITMDVDFGPLSSEKKKEFYR